jgi:sugar lactone lactonase YvrE
MAGPRRFGPAWSILPGTLALLLASHCGGGGGGGQAAAVPPPPPVSVPVITRFTAAQSPITLGASTALTASFSGGTGALDQGIGPVTSGTPVAVTPAVAGTTTYTLTVSNGVSTPATQALGVQVVAPPVVASFGAASGVLTLGSGTTLTSSFTGGTGVITPGNLAVTSGQATAVTPLTSTTYTLTVTNLAGTSSSATTPVTVVPAPTATRFGAHPPSLGSGASATVTAVFNAGPGGSASLDHGLGPVTSEVGIATGPLTTSTTYTLTLTNAAGLSASWQLKLPVGATSLLAGAPSGVGRVDGTGTAARFNNPFGAAVDGSLNVYLADSGNHTIRKITPGGVVTTVAGSPGLQGITDGTGAAARFSYPRGVALDPAGTVLYVADYGNQTVRQVTLASGQVTTLAGVAGKWGSADGQGTAAAFDYPSGVAVAGDGTIYVADTANDLIRKVTPGGAVTTLAGTLAVGGSQDAKGMAASFFRPIGLAVDGSGNVLVADTGNSTLRRITPDGTVTTLAGSAGQIGSADGLGAKASFSSPFNVAVDASGNAYVTDVGNNTVRMVTPGGLVSTLAGTPGVSGDQDSTGAAALFDWPNGIAVDGSGTLYVADYSNNTLRVIASGGVVTTRAGSRGQEGTGDGQGANARFYRPQGLAWNGSGSAYLADQGNETIRVLAEDGTVSTLAGSPGVVGSADGSGGSARFSSPTAVVVGTGVLYVADTDNSTIRQVSPAGAVTTLAGSAGLVGSADGPGTSARFNRPGGIALGSGGSLYVADTVSGTVRKVAPDGTVSTLAGLAGQIGSADGLGSAASFNAPTALAVDAAGNVYVADTGNHTIRMVTPAGLVSTLAGSPGQQGSQDGIGTAAGFNGPTGLALDAVGNLYVADRGNSAVRIITKGGVVNTILGQAGQAEVVPGNFPGLLAYPDQLAVHPTTGALFITTRDAVLKATFQ